MRKVCLFIIFLAPFILSAQNNLTLEKIWSSADFYPKGVYGITMLNDGDHYVQQTYDFKTQASILIKYHFEKAQPVDTIFNSSKTAGMPESFMLEGYSFSPQQNFLVLETNSNAIYRHSKEAQYYILNLKSKKVTPVYESKAVFYPAISPSEDKLAFVYENNLYIQDLNSGSVQQVTTDGEMNKIINAKTDWVYEEEFALVEGFAWSPKGDKIAYYKFDESEVKQYQLAVYDALYPTQYTYKYPLAGEDNSIVSIWVYDLGQNKSSKMNLGEQNDQYLPRTKWTNNNNILSVQRLNRNQNEFELLFVNTTTGEPKQVYKEKNDTYIDISDNLTFLPNNSFFLTSEKEGFNQIYHYSASGELVKKVTTSQADVNDILAVDTKNKTIYYTANDPSPLVRNIYQINFDGSKRKMLSDEESGRKSAQFSTNNKYYILTSSSVSTPTNVGIYNIKSKKLRMLEENNAVKEKVTSYGLSTKEFISIPVGNNVNLNGWMIKPKDFDQNKKYPVLFSIYGGPGHQMVKDEWGGALDMWYHYLASKGIIVVSVDNRGTGGRGADFKKQTYKKLGQMESDDQIAAAKYFAKLPYVDGDRIGIYGWSFGGYMSALSLMKGRDVFDMAVSVAPVTDWRLYDNIYTERFMQRPVDNQQGYDSSSVLNYVPQLRGDILIVHGTFDDNVHPHNTMMLIRELIKHNKKFDTEFYPDKNHGIYGGNTRLHLYTRITDYILEHL